MYVPDMKESYDVQPSVELYKQGVLKLLTCQVLNARLSAGKDLADLATHGVGVFKLTKTDDGRVVQDDEVQLAEIRCDKRR